MAGKSFLTLTLLLLLLLMVVSGEAYANHNYQHRPDQVPTARPGRLFYAPFVMEGRSAFVPRVPGANSDKQRYLYRGIRKSR